MTEKRASLEVIAPSVDEAVEKGLNDLGLPRDAVDLEILDEGGRGLFGLGSRQARVRLTIKSSPATPVTETKTAVVSAPEATPAPMSHPLGDDYILGIARDTVIELLEKMKVRATVTAEFGEMDDEKSRLPIQVNINGDDLSILIGRRAETLNALQYIAALIVSKEVGRTIPLVVDVQGYRTRRENQLRQLARRMADQALKTGRRQVLEPMPANERRIIHMELRDNPAVNTESIGEEPRRKITIFPAE